MEELEKCEICPHRCKINRNEGKIGVCGAGKNIKISITKLHYDEEPCISGKNGSGTVFFSSCNLKCVFCQNYKISQEKMGHEITIEELAEEFLKLQKQGANNINLVTGTIYVPQIIETLKIAKKKGLTIPVAYNTRGYENIETLKKLDGYIDIYMPDFKYFYSNLGEKLSGIKNYANIAKDAIIEMQRQITKNEFDENGLMKKGIIIRHLVLPNHIQNSIRVLEWLKENIREDVFVSLMAQYFPTHKASEYNDINRKLTKKEYNEIKEYFYELDFKNGFIQDLEDEEEKYVPEFK